MIDVRGPTNGVASACERVLRTLPKWFGIEQSLLARGARVLQVKTMAAIHPSAEYADTRAFYEALGYVPLEVFPALCGPKLPVLQLIRVLEDPG